MKRAIAALACLFLSAAMINAYTARSHQYGGVFGTIESGIHDADDTTFVNYGSIQVVDWNDPLLPAHFDSALALLKKGIDIITLDTRKSCVCADSGYILNALGRLTPFDLPGLNKTGPWQWDRPLVIHIADSTTCPFLFRLSARRWTKIIVGPDDTTTRDVVVAYEDLVHRYKRERVDRIEEMFRK